VAELEAATTALEQAAADWGAHRYTHHHYTWIIRIGHAMVLSHPDLVEQAAAAADWGAVEGSHES
jgi:hypothetical protein